MEEKELLYDDNQNLMERVGLSMERICTIKGEETVAEPFRDYFINVAEFIGEIQELYYKLQNNLLEDASIEVLEKLNDSLYKDIVGDAYEHSFANPAHSVSLLGEGYGQLLSFLYTELRGMIVYAYEGRLVDLTICSELFIEVYNLFEHELPAIDSVKDVLYWFVSDYCDITLTYRIKEQVDPTLSFAKSIIKNCDLTDLRYLYQYGEYISQSELEVANFLNSLPQSTIDLMADTYTEGYKKGFDIMGKELSKKKTVVIRYQLGFERMIQKAISNFEQLGLEIVIYRAAVNSINKNQTKKNGYYSSSPNKQYDYDHRFDCAIYLDKAFKERKLSVLRVAFEQHKLWANGQAGPAVVETFGELLFEPVNKKEAYQLDEKQQKLSVTYSNESSQITNEFIPGDERSFTIIAFPIPQIGPDFKAIFKETIRINTLNYEEYKNYQQIIIDALDQAEYVHILGNENNLTDLKICLRALESPAKETNFENCVADVNIPLGEVFTTPKLAGTQGTLYVGKVYLHEIEFKELLLTFQNGKITDYTCKNFADEAENKKLIQQNILYNHDTLPMGEFAIGTNTTAYAMAQRFGILRKLPILIVEKMGPHFAVGDTCYSWSEDNPIFNPDGKEIVARDNEVSILRKEDISKAYYSCHTDITIPYSELDSIEAVKPDGTVLPIISGGFFVLPGTEELNKPLT